MYLITCIETTSLMGMQSQPQKTIAFLGILGLSACLVQIKQKEQPMTQEHHGTTYRLIGVQLLSFGGHYDAKAFTDLGVEILPSRETL